MSNILVINASGQETRVALIEQGTISEYYLERKNEKGIVGNIYKGKVVRVLPGMQAAFVDIGLDKAAFLYVGDIVSDPTFPGFSEEMDIKAGSVEGDPLEAEDLPEPADEVVPQPGETPPPHVSMEGSAAAETSMQSAAVDVQPGEAAPAADASRQEPVPAEAAAGAQTAEPAEIVELHPDDAIEEEEDGGGGDDDDEEELDEADAAHAAAEEALAAEQAQAAQSPGATAEPVAEAPQGYAQAAPAPPVADAGARGLPADQRPAAREGRRGRRRGGRGRKRGGEAPRPAGEQPKADRRQDGNGKPWQTPERRGGNGEKRNGNGKRAQIQDLLKEGDEVLVQVVKDPIGTKGARITCHISLPGRHLVFMPTVDHVGISRRIENEKERRRLRELVDRYRPPGTGFIVRTVAENEPSEKLTADIKFLLGLWNEVGNALGVQSFRKAFYMPVSRLRGPLGLVKARLAIPAIAAIRCGRPISVETMAGMLKVSPRTVRRWIRKSGITPIKNLAIVAPLRPGSRLKDYLATGGPNLRTIKFRGQRFLCRQIANSFPEFGQEGVRSRLRHANRSVRRLRAGATTFVHTGEGTRRSRLYVESGNRETTIPSHPVVYTLVGTVKKPVHGAPPVRLWSPVIPEVRG